MLGYPNDISICQFETQLLIHTNNWYVQKIIGLGVPQILQIKVNGTQNVLRFKTENGKHNLQNRSSVVCWPTQTKWNELIN